MTEANPIPEAATDPAPSAAPSSAEKDASISFLRARKAHLAAMANQESAVKNVSIWARAVNEAKKLLDEAEAELNKFHIPKL